MSSADQTSLKPSTLWDFDPLRTEGAWAWDEYDLSVVPLWERVAAPRELKSGLALSKVGSPVWRLDTVRITRRNQGWQLTGPSRVSYTTADAIALFARFRITDTSGASSDFNATPAEWAESDETDGMSIEVDTSGNLFVATIGGNTLGETTTAVDDNKFHNCLAIFDQPNNTITVDVDGDEQYQVTSFTDNSTANALNVGSVLSSDQDIIDLWVDFVVAIKGVPSQALRRMLGVDPFALIRQVSDFRAPRVFVPSGVTTVQGAATLAGSADIIASAFVTQKAAATMAGAGDIDATAKLTIPAAATMAGAGDIDAVGNVRVPGAATLAGAGDLSASAFVTQKAQASLDGTGDLSASAKVTQKASATLAGSGDLVGTGNIPGAIVSGGALLRRRRRGR